MQGTTNYCRPRRRYRETKGEASLLLVDMAKAGAGKDGIYSAAGGRRGEPIHRGSSNSEKRGYPPSFSDTRDYADQR